MTYFSVKKASVILVENMAERQLQILLSFFNFFFVQSMVFFIVAILGRHLNHSSCKRNCFSCIIVLSTAGGYCRR